VRSLHCCSAPVTTATPGRPHRNRAGSLDRTESMITNMAITVPAATSDQTFAQSVPDPELLTSGRYLGPLPGQHLRAADILSVGASLGHVTCTADKTRPTRPSGIHTASNRMRRSVT
jgi:hypothetical protein